MLDNIKNTAQEALETEKNKIREVELRCQEELARSRSDVTAAEERGKQVGLANREAALKDLEEKLHVRVSICTQTNAHRITGRQNGAKKSVGLNRQSDNLSANWRRV